MEKLEVINNKWVKVQLSSGIVNEILWFSIESVDTFERNLEIAVADLGMEKKISIPCCTRRRWRCQLLLLWPCSPC
jgi:hypothetical protein